MSIKDSDEEKVPELHSTEGIPLEEKVIFEHWVLLECNFHWLIAELDSWKKLGFGYAFLNDSQNAEWGYISIEELEKTGASKIRGFGKLKFSEAIKGLSEKNMIIVPVNPGH